MSFEVDEQPCWHLFSDGTANFESMMSFSFQDRKERIVKYLKGETGRVPKKIEDEIIEDLSTVYSQSGIYAFIILQTILLTEKQ